MGPNGAGSMTGRSLGHCAGYDSPGFTKGQPLGGAGYGRGFAHRFGRNSARSFPPVAAPYQYAAPVPLSREQELNLLKNQADQLQESLKAVKVRIEALDDQKK